MFDITIRIHYQKQTQEVKSATSSRAGIWGWPLERATLSWCRSTIILGESEAEGMKIPTLSEKNAAVLIIDPQEKLLPKVFESRRVIANTVLLIRFARFVGLPLIVTTQYEKGIGPIVDGIKKELPDELFVDKVEFGCFNNAKFVEHMGKLDKSRNTLILSGIESHICVAQTALGAIEKGYNVHIASDAVSSRVEWNWKIGLDRMKEAGAVISSTEMIIFEVLRQSDSAEFKKILPDLKDPVC
jgi:nicotinamidase-related amidase